MMERRFFHFEPTLRPSARRTEESAWWRENEEKSRKDLSSWCARGASEWPRIIALDECRRCADNEDDGDAEDDDGEDDGDDDNEGKKVGEEEEDEVGLDDRLDPVEIIRYFPIGGRADVVFWYVTFRP